MYEEDVHVPLMFWYPRMYNRPLACGVGSHVDLAPTIAELIGLPPRQTGRDAAFSTRVIPARVLLRRRRSFQAWGSRGELEVHLQLRDGREELYDLRRSAGAAQCRRAASRAQRSPAAAAGSLDRSESPAVRASGSESLSVRPRLSAASASHFRDSAPVRCRHPSSSRRRPGPSGTQADSRWSHHGAGGSAP